MPSFCRNSLICLLVILIPVSVNAMSRLYDADAVITMRNGRPCFSYPQDEEIQKRPYSFGHLSVSKNGPLGGILWEIGISSSDRKGLLEPNSQETCFEYGVLYPGTEVIKSAQPLQIGMPINVLIRVSTLGEGSFYVRKYLSNFCINKNEKGEPILVGAAAEGNGDWHCLKPGESPKRSLWQKLFGK